MEFCQLVRSSRSEKHKTAREFHQKSDLPCSYFYYSTIEKGTAIPNIDLALKIIEALEMDRRKAIFSWARSQMPDNETKSIFADVDRHDSPSLETTPASKALVINRPQSRYLTKNPIAMELITYINLEGENVSSSPSKLANFFNSDVNQINETLINLYDLGLIDKSDSGSYVAKDWVFVPFTSEYEKLNNNIFKRSYAQFERSSDSTKIRHVATVMLTDDKKTELQGKIKSLINWAVAANQDKSDEAKPYTLGMFGSRRIFGNAD